MLLHAPAPDTFSVSPQASRGGGVLQYNGRSYAVGLLWLAVQEESGKKLLKERINRTKADFYCERLHISQQQGFGWLDRGHRRGMHAAAAMVADQLVGEWHGVFEADNGWWYVQVRSDTITPNGDRFFASEEDAFHVFQEEAQKNIWPHSYAPERWHLADTHTRELPLRNLLDDLGTTNLVATNLTSMFGNTALRNIVLVGILMCLLVVGGLVLHTATKPPPAPKVRKPRVTRTIEAQQEKVMEAVSPKQLLQQCGHAADKLYYALPGWNADEFNCAVGKAAMRWRQESGRLSTARRVGSSVWPKNTAMTFDNRSLTATLPLGNLPKVERQQPVTQDMALLYLEQNLQPMGNLQIKPIVPRPPRQNRRPAAAARGKAAVPVVPPPPYLQIKFMSGYGPTHVAPVLEAPGLELVNAQWRVPQGVWNYDLKWIYEAPKTAATTQGTKTPAAGNTAATNAASPTSTATGATTNTNSAAQQDVTTSPAAAAPKVVQVKP